MRMAKLQLRFIVKEKMKGLKAVQKHAILNAVGANEIERRLDSEHLFMVAFRLKLVLAARSFRTPRRRLF